MTNKYFAFISYSGKDEKVVKWLHRKLENYRIPTSIASDADFGSGERSGGKPVRYLRPVFWYKQDLSGTVLSESLTSNLSDSRFLIVVCSPAAAASEWVNDEVATFIRQGKESKIIPLIASGVPNSGDPATECFPKALRELSRERELRGINLDGQGREHALVDVIATMLGVRFDTLWQRHKRRRRRQMAIGAAAALVLALICIGVWDYNRSRTEYFLHWAEGPGGVPQGIEPISKNDLSRAGAAFRFTYSRTPLGEPGALSWRLDRVEYVNPRGYVSNDTPDGYSLFYPIQEFRYQEGNLAEITNKDSYGRTLLRYSVKDYFDGSPAAIYDITGGEIGQSAGYLAASTALTSGYDESSKNRRSKIKRLHIIRNSAGRVERITYHANNDDDLASSITADNNGFYGQAFTRDSLGRTTSITTLNEYGLPAEDFRGVATIAYTYGRPRTIEFHNAAGRLVPGNLGVAKIVMDVNDFGRVDSSSYFDADGIPALSADYVHTVVHHYDDRGFETSRDALDTEGRITPTRYGWSRMELEYDSRGLVVRDSYFGPDGKPVLSEDKYSVGEYEYNSDGLHTRVRYYGTDGAPAYKPSEGDYGQSYSYDSEGYLKELKLLGPDGKPFDSPDTNYAEIRYTHDKYHRCIKMEYLDAAGMPVRCKSGHAGVLRTYDTRGNETEIVYIDPQGRPTFTQDGPAIVRREYDPRGNVTGVYYFGPDGTTQAFVQGRYAEEAEYSPRGQQTVKRFVSGTDGRLAAGPLWWAYRVREFDNIGRKTAEAYFGPDSLPTLDKDFLAARVEYVYDGDNNIVSEAFFGRDGRPVRQAHGYHRLAATYDSVGHILSRRYFAPDGSPALFDGQYHRDSMRYDRAGNRIYMAVFLPDGAPAVSDQKVHRIEIDYDSRGLITETRRYGADGKPLRPDTPERYATVRMAYNSRGKLSDTRYYDNAGQPFQYIGSNDDRGRYRETIAYNGRGLPEKYTYYSARDTVEPDFWIESTFNPYGKVISLASFDSEGRPLEIQSRARSEYGYDRLGRRKSIKYFTDNGKLTLWETMEYDSLGRIVKNSNLNADSALTVNHVRGMETRFAVLEKKYDAHGNETEFAYYGTDGRLMDAGNGFAIVRHKYDPQGRRIETAVFDPEGRPTTIGTYNWHKQTTKYNDRNLIEQIDYCGTDGRPTNSLQSVQPESRTVFRYDDYGRRNGVESFRYENGRYIHNEPIAAAATGGAKQVMGVVEMPGSFKDAGISGAFYILVFDTWTIHDSFEEFGRVLGSTGNRERRIVYLPLVETSGGGVGFGEPVDRVFPAGPLGIRLFDTSYEGISEILENYFKSIEP